MHLKALLHLNVNLLVAIEYFLNMQIENRTVLEYVEIYWQQIVLKIF